MVSSTAERRAALDAVLDRNGHARNIAATLMSFTILPELLLQADHVGVFSHRTTDYVVERYPLISVPIPLEVAPIANHLIWHRRFERDQTHACQRAQTALASGGHGSGRPQGPPPHGPFQKLIERFAARIHPRQGAIATSRALSAPSGASSPSSHPFMAIRNAVTCQTVSGGREPGSLKGIMSRL
ncbi:hypothetical protein C7455_110123 [Roseicyclus mahoneyensis]|uniref:LysR substrate binding domain-containing protein n=1 Tax=Roseicyclus mahoneyensis TaxID=164332 RepID=A0A316GC15_9RHOB|nr:hypothetical protein C7455_110123 [Roseicyclus mahoneyensis]